MSEDDFRQAGERLLADLESEAVLITRGSDGMSLIERDSPHLHIPVSNRSEVFDVTGVGDRVIGVLTLALAAVASMPEAAYLSNYAVGLVLRKLGNATTQEELAWAIENW